MKTTKFVMLALCLLFLSASNSHAYTVYCTNCSEKVTQALDRVTNVQQLDTVIRQHAEDVQQTAQQIRMVQQNIEQYQNMLQNTKNLSPDMLSGLSGEFRKLSDLQRQVRLQRGDAQALSRTYEELYPGGSAMSGQSNEEYQRRWDKWSQESNRAWQSAFQVTGRQLEDLEDEEFDRKVQELLNTPEGRMEAMQAANQLTAMQLREAREMRSLMNAYIQAQIQAASKAEQDAQAQQETHRKFMNMDNLNEVGKTKGMADPL